MAFPKIVSGKKFTDVRGKLTFNNDFDASEVKRIYFIENANKNFIRAWQGHRIEQRWFSAVCGEFEIKLVKVDNWENPDKNLESLTTLLKPDDFEVLHIPAGYISSIQAKKENSKLLVMSDFAFEEIKDEYRYPSDYFSNT